MNAPQLTRQASIMADVINLARRNHVANATVVRPLREGVEMLLRYEPATDHYVLVLRSEAGYPTPDDLTAVAAAFGLELDTILPDTYRTRDLHPASGRLQFWHNLRVMWREERGRNRTWGNTFSAPCEA